MYNINIKTYVYGGLIRGLLVIIIAYISIKYTHEDIGVNYMSCIQLLLYKNGNILSILC